MTTTTTPADTIKSIAAIYIASAEAAENFINTRDQAEKERHSELFKSASEKFKALIEEDSSLHDCELREISYAITKHNFNDAKARYSALTKTTPQENDMNDHNTDEKILDSIYSLTLDKNLKELKKIESEIGKDKFNEITRDINYNDDQIAESLKWVTKHWTESPEEKIAKFEAMDAEFKTPETLEEAIQIAELFTEEENIKGLKILKDTVGEEIWSGVMKEINETAWLYGDKIETITEYWGQIDHTTQENTMTTKKKYAVSNATTHNTIIRTGGFDLRTTVTGLKIIHTDLNSRLTDRVALPVLDSDSVSVKITELGFKMMEDGRFEEFYKNLKEVENTANKIQEALNQHNRQLEHHKWENEELTTGDVAELMGFSAEMIRRYCVEGKIKSRETSRGRKIKRKDAFLFMENHPKFNS